MNSEQIIEVLEEFERLENMKALERKKYIFKLRINSPMLAEQLDSFFKNPKRIREVFYRELRNRI